MDVFWHGIDFNEGSTKFSDYSTHIWVQPVIDSIIYQRSSVFCAKNKMNPQKCKCTSQIKFLFSFALLGLFVGIISLSRGFTPGYTLSALRA